MVAVLIDFDNFFGSDTSKITSEILEFHFSELVNLCEAQFSNFNSIFIRLYGGWHYETILTKKASTIQQLLSKVNVFPKIKDGKIIHGSIEIINSLHEIPEFIWYYSYKETNGIKRIRINYEEIDEICNQNREQCPKFIIHKFTKSKTSQCPVNGCKMLQRDVFKGIEQKMVDTLIACDIISLSEDADSEGIIIVSDDQDLFPSIALAKRRIELNPRTNFQGISLVIQNEQNQAFINNFLQPFNIQTLLLS